MTYKPLLSQSREYLCLPKLTIKRDTHNLIKGETMTIEKRKSDRIETIGFLLRPLVTSISNGAMRLCDLFRFGIHINMLLKGSLVLF